MSEIANPFSDGTGFSCGPYNPSGLKLTFRRDRDGGVRRQYV
ncbi:MAG TPA: hypothetical protein VKA04_00335 [Pseudodesulfovibrio sp.]|nr:hypothetical protein [Pseudodesulfovibrio sp.]